MKKTIPIATLILIVGAGIYFVINKTPTKINEKDTQKVVNEKQTETKEDITEKIEEALREKYDWEKGQVIITVNKNDGSFASGSVMPADPNEMGGAGWFAGKVSGTWKIIWDGNGTPTCDQIEAFDKDVPTSLMSDCYDENTNAMIKR